MEDVIDETKLRKAAEKSVHFQEIEQEVTAISACFEAWLHLLRTRALLTHEARTPRSM